MHFEEWILFQKLAWRGVAASSISGKSTGASSTCGSWNHELLQHPLTLPAGIVHHLSGPNTYAPNSNFWTERPSLSNSYSGKNLIPTQKTTQKQEKGSFTTFTHHVGKGGRGSFWWFPQPQNRIPPPICGATSWWIHRWPRGSQRLNEKRFCLFPTGPVPRHLWNRITSQGIVWIWNILAFE